MLNLKILKAITMYKKHVFVCENIRDSSNKKSCGKIGVSIRIKCAVVSGIDMFFAAGPASVALSGF